MGPGEGRIVCVLETFTVSSTLDVLWLVAE